MLTIELIDGQSVATWIHRDPNLVGIAMAQKRRFGRPAGEISVTAYVRKKLPLQAVDRQLRIPKNVVVSGQLYPTDVVEMRARTVPTAESTMADFVPLARHRPAGPGAQLGAQGSAAATFGALVIDNSDDSVQILTACSAVMNDKFAEVGTPIFQPLSWLGGVIPGNQIGTLTRSANLSTYPRIYPDDGLPLVNPFDGAIVKPGQLSHVMAASVVNPDMPPNELQPIVGMIIGCEEISDLGETCYIASTSADIFDGLNIRPYGRATLGTPELGQRVHFYGASQGLNYGTIIAVGSTVTLGYAIGWTPHKALISNTFFIQADSDSDLDIGSVVHTWAGNQVRSKCSGCAIVFNLEATYDVAMSADIELADWLRDQYVMRTYTGAILVQLFYRNESQFQQRMLDADPTETERRFAEILFDKYAEIVRNEREGVFGTFVPITADTLDDIAAATYGLSRFMTEAEYAACVQLIALLHEAEGLSVAEAMRLMDQVTTADNILNIIENVPGWDFSYDVES